MNTLHREILCSHSIIHSHGARRRRCSHCGKTWVKWKRRRGRKPQPRRLQHLARTFLNGLTLTQQAGAQHMILQTLTARHRVLLKACAARTRIVYPKGALLLIVDGLWFTFQRKKWTLYCMALRTVRGTRARILPPILVLGKESAWQWQALIGELPYSVRRRVKALISDHFSGVETIAEQEGWLLQLCHFHLISYLYTILGSNKRTVKWRRGRFRAYRAVRALLTEQDPKQAQRITRQIATLLKDPECPRRWKMRLREFLRCAHLYRTYLSYPELNLPTTTNAVENLNSRLRALTYRSRGFRTPQALERWVNAYIHFHPTVKCNGKTIKNLQN